ncbi:MAG: metallophosphoesterase [Pirellulales bacterium]|nr:metallophosphoesterase [Pirellulales bacterium]
MPMTDTNAATDDSAPPLQTSPPARRWSRRRFLLNSVLATMGTGVAALGYSAIEAGWVGIVRQQVAIPRLPTGWIGGTIVQLTDIHHGKLVSLGYIGSVVDAVNALQPDVICLTGDYVSRGGELVDPCLDLLGCLRPRVGIFAVPGNHDYYQDVRLFYQAVERNSMVNLTNRGEWAVRNGSRLRIAGVDDLWHGQPNFDGLREMQPDDAGAILLSHNPDFVEQNPADPRVGLVLSGHTHGGQLCLPIYGAPVVPSRYGQKYVHGLVQGPLSQVYVSRGVGTVAIPLRFGAPPEITVIELTRA